MIEIEIHITCEECGEETTLDETELQDVANFTNVVGCWALVPENLPEGFVYDEQECEIYCTNCRKEEEE